MRYCGLAFAIVAAVVAAIAVGRGNGSNAAQYKTEQARRGDLTVVVTATGTLQPKKEVQVGSELSGTIKNVEVDYNSRVTAGQVLAMLDTTKLEATISQCKASLESARAKVLQARATVTEAEAKLSQFRKVQELSKGKTPSQTDMNAAEAAYRRAVADEASCEAAVMQAEAILKVNETDLRKSTIRSPIDGVVLTRNVDPGQTVAAAMTTPVLFKIAEDLSKIDLHVNVDEADVSGAKEGQKATFSVAAYPRRTFDATITQVRFGSSTTSGVVTYETVLDVDNRDLALRPGMTATADIVTRKVKDALLMPSAALRFVPPAQVTGKKSSGGLMGALLPHPLQPKEEPNDGATKGKNAQRVWVVRSDRLSAIPVTVGASNGGMTEILSGEVAPGTQVVVDVAGASK